MTDIRSHLLALPLGVAALCVAIPQSSAGTYGHLETWISRYEAGNQNALREIAVFGGLGYRADDMGARLAGLLINEAKEQSAPAKLIKMALERYRCLPDLASLALIKSLKAVAETVRARCPESPVYLQAKSDDTPIRSWPGQGNDVVGMLAKDMLVDLLPSREPWLHVRAWNGTEGYVHGSGMLRYRPPELLPFEHDGKWGFQNRDGETVLKPQYRFVQGFLQTGIAAVVDDKGWAYINRSGGVLIRPFEFDNGPDYFEEGLARFVRNGKMGFFDRSGRIVIPARFEWVEPFSGGRARFCEGCKKEEEGEHFRMTGGRWGYVDHKGNVIVRPH